MDKTKKRKVENHLAESFEKAIKNLQKEGFLKEAKSFDLNFNGKGINIKLNENENSIFPCKLIASSKFGDKKTFHYRLNSDNPNNIFAMWDDNDTSDNNDAILNNEDDFYTAVNELSIYIDKTYNMSMRPNQCYFSHELLYKKRYNYHGIEMKLINVEDEDGQTSKYPLTEAYFNIISVDEIWSSFEFSDTYSFYSELEDETGIDYDDVKDQCWDCTPEYETEEVVNRLGEMGSEQFLSKYFTSPEDIKSKSWEELANVETEDGQDLMELIMDEFIDITDYADELYHDAYEAAKEELQRNNY